MTAIASCALPDEAEPLAQQMRMLTEMAYYAMRMARAAVEQYEASVAAERALANAPPTDSATTRPRRQPCPGSLCIRATRAVQNCILGYSRLAAGLPIGRLALPRPTAREAATHSNQDGMPRGIPPHQAP